MIDHRGSMDWHRLLFKMGNSHIMEVKNFKIKWWFIGFLTLIFTWCTNTSHIKSRRMNFHSAVSNTDFKNITPFMYFYILSVMHNTRIFVLGLTTKTRYRFLLSLSKWQLHVQNACGQKSKLLIILKTRMSIFLASEAQILIDQHLQLTVTVTLICLIIKTMWSI